jgi:hypothetical protein
VRKEGREKDREVVGVIRRKVRRHAVSRRGKRMII